MSVMIENPKWTQEQNQRFKKEHDLLASRLQSLKEWSVKLNQMEKTKAVITHESRINDIVR